MQATVSPARVSQVLTEMDVNYFFTNTMGPRWFLPHGGGLPTLQIVLNNEGEWLYLGSDELLDLEAVPSGERPFVLKRLMEANDNIKLGRYVGVKKIRAEVTLGLRDAPLGEGQLRQHVGALVSLVEYFVKEFADERDRVAQTRPNFLRDLLKSLGMQVDADNSNSDDDGNAQP